MFWKKKVETKKKMCNNNFSLFYISFCFQEDMRNLYFFQSRVNFTNCPNWTKLMSVNYKDLVLIYIIKKRLTWLVMGSVLIWHMYNPLSLRCTTSISNVQELWPLWLTLMRGLLVTICVWMAKMAFESDRSHATFKNKRIHKLKWKSWFSD